MIVRKGNILSVTEGAILHQVNCQGVMGSGIAKQIRQKYPVVYDKYMNLYNDAVDVWGGIEGPLSLLGMAQVVTVSDRLQIVNIFGQLKYGKDGQIYTSYGALQDAFKSLNKLLDASVQLHFPLLGCGLGGGDWSVVSAILKDHFHEDRLNLWLLD